MENESTNTEGGVLVELVRTLEGRLGAIIGGFTQGRIECSNSGIPGGWNGF